MAFALYVPALKGKSKADALSGQTVVFAFAICGAASWSYCKLLGCRLLGH